MAKRGNTKLFKVLVCQMRQYYKANIVLSKALTVLPKAELLQPVRNLLHHGPASSPQEDKSLTRWLVCRY